MYRIPRCLHFDSPVPAQPQWDTLIGICNPYPKAVNVVIRCIGSDGAEVPKSPIRFTLQPGHSIANTFIKGNTWPDPPQNWAGYATVEFEPANPFDAAHELPVMACLGGNGPGSQNWNGATPGVDVLGTVQRKEGAATRWVFPYVIPYFRDPAQHADKHEYRTGLSITNLDRVPAILDVCYTVGDIYPNAGQQCRATLTVPPPGCSVAAQLHELMPECVTMNPRAGQIDEYEGSEGWLDIRSASPVNLMMWLECANRDYDCLGFAQSPWAI